MQEEYQAFKERVKRLKGTIQGTIGFTSKDHPSVIEVIFSKHLVVDKIISSPSFKHGFQTFCDSVFHIKIRIYYLICGFELKIETGYKVMLDLK